MNKEDYQKLMEQAKKVTITSVMDEQGMDYIDMRNFAQSVEHDSLMIDKRKNRFYWNSQIEDGKVVSGDTIDFVKRFFNKSHMEALTCWSVLGLQPWPTLRGRGFKPQY